MARMIVVIAVLLTTMTAVVIFLTRDMESPREQLEKENDYEPRVVVDDFSFYRYDGHQIQATFSAKLAHFVEPNIIETYASIRGVRYRQSRTETLRCEAAQAEFNADSMGDLLDREQVEINKAEVEDQVRIGMGEYLLQTEYAQYSGPTQLLSSEEPVMVDGPKRHFVGEQGFVYDMKKESLQMPGKVRGVVIPDEKR